jgi:DNA-binding NarL/FixJ family response regulator
MKRRGARGRRRSGAGSETAPVAVPAGLRCGRLALAGEEYLVLDFPLKAAQEEGRGPWSLTAAERAVAAAAAAGLSNREIADERGVSERTVANQLAAIYQKLGINSRAELAACWHGGLAMG